MKKLILFIWSILLVNCALAQHVAIPQFKSNSMTSDNPFPSIKNYDLILACRAYDGIAHRLIFNILVLKSGHWQKLNGTLPAQNVPLSVDEPALKPVATTDAECSALLTGLTNAHLFNIEDDNTLPKCNQTIELLNGVRQTVTHSIEDGPEYRIWIATPKKVRYLYYASPKFFAQYCADNKDRANVVKIVDLFTKSWPVQMSNYN
ncbi:MAG TPA: hypothetical protein VIQ77_06935 [Mucilaginibacter sp.]